MGNKGTFVRVNGATTQMLQKIMPFIACGYPTVETVRALLLKRAYCKIRGNRYRLNDNQQISDNLGKYGVHCMEDLIHQIYTVGPYFKQCNLFLWAFKLISPRG